MNFFDCIQKTSSQINTMGVSEGLLEKLITNIIIPLIISLILVPLITKVINSIKNRVFCIVQVRRIVKKTSELYRQMILKIFFYVGLIAFWYLTLCFFEYSYSHYEDVINSKLYVVACIIFGGAVLLPVILSIYTHILKKKNKIEKNEIIMWQEVIFSICEIISIVLTAFIVSACWFYDYYEESIIIGISEIVVTMTCIILAIKYYWLYCKKNAEKTVVPIDIILGLLILTQIYAMHAMAIKMYDRQELINIVYISITFLWFALMIVEFYIVVNRDGYAEKAMIYTTVQNLGTIATEKKVTWYKEQYIKYKDKGENVYIPLECITSIRYNLKRKIFKNKKRYRCLNNDKIYYDVIYERNDYCTLMEEDSVEKNLLKVTFKRNENLIFTREKIK